MVGIDISFEKISEIIQNQAEDENTEINIIIQNGMYLTHKDKRNILSEQNNLFSNPSFLAGKILYQAEIV